MVEQAKREEGWVPTTCYGCFPSCGIQVKRKDGKVVASRGDPGAHSTLGKCCGKSVSRVADLYHPNRLTRPLLRTNPKKGIGVDPQWKEIGWEEAADIVVERLGKVLRDDPRKLVMGSMDMNNYFFQVGDIFKQGDGTVGLVANCYFLGLESNKRNDYHVRSTCVKSKFPLNIGYCSCCCSFNYHGSSNYR